MKVAYLFTTFPLLSETPYQRELRVLAGLPVELEIYSLWGGDAIFEGQDVQRFNKWRIVTLLWLLPYWVVRKPPVFSGLIKRLVQNPLPSPLNAGETVLGLAFALCYAQRFARGSGRPDLFHAAWATLPATAAQLLKELTGVPFTMGGHAYDVFRHGGDWDLASKLQKAALVVTSSASTRESLIERGAEPAKTVLVRRGLDALPAGRAPRAKRDPIRILAVGRLVEKKGYLDQLAIYAAFKMAGLRFEARIVGAGPLQGLLQRRIAEQGLSDSVTLTGALSQDSVFEQYAWADVMFFTGTIARSGDRDGLPNVIPEAMACGVPIVATPVAGVPEAVQDGRTGLLIREKDTDSWSSALKRLQSDDGFYKQLCAGARSWVETHYDARRNMSRLLALFQAASATAFSDNESSRLSIEGGEPS